MSISTLSTIFKQKGSAEIDISFTNTSGDPETPLTMSWTLTDTSGTVVNSRQAVSVDDMASTITIKLSGLDLAVSELVQETRVLTVQGTYTDEDGEEAVYVDAVKLLIDQVVGVQ